MVKVAPCRLVAERLLIACSSFEAAGPKGLAYFAPSASPVSMTPSRMRAWHF
jgi:hypothetical protein